MTNVMTPEIFTIKHYVEKYKTMCGGDLYIEIQKDIKILEPDLDNQYHKIRVREVDAFIRALSFLIFHSSGAEPHIDTWKIELIREVWERVDENNKAELKRQQEQK